MVMLIHRLRKNMVYWLVLFSCCLLSCAAVSIAFNSMGLFYAPISKELGVGIGDVSLFLTIAQMTCGLCGPTAVKLAMRSDVRILLAIGTAFLITPFVGIYFLHRIWFFYFLGMVCGFGVACTGPVIISLIISNWFEKGLGTAIGLSYASSGLGSAILSPIINNMIENMGWRTVGLWLCLFIFIAMLLPVCFLRLHPWELRRMPYGAAQTAEPPAQIKKAPPEKFKFTAVIVLMCFVSAFTSCCNGFSSHLPNFALNLNYPSATGALMSSMAMIGNSSSKLLIGILRDKMGIKRSIFLFIIIAMFGFSGLTFLTAAGKPVMLLSALLMGFVYAIAGVGLSLVGQSVFGVEKAGIVYSYVSVAGYGGNALTQSAFGYSYDFTGSYVLASSSCLVLLTVSAVLLMFIFRKKDAGKTL